MNTRGLVELIVLNLGLQAKILDVEIFTIMVMMALVTTIMTSPIVEYIYPPSLRLAASTDALRAAGAVMTPGGSMLAEDSMLAEVSFCLLVDAVVTLARCSMRTTHNAQPTNPNKTHTKTTQGEALSREAAGEGGAMAMTPASAAAFGAARGENGGDVELAVSRGGSGGGGCLVFGIVCFCLVGLGALVWEPRTHLNNQPNHPPPPTKQPWAAGSASRAAAPGPTPGSPCPRRGRRAAWGSAWRRRCRCGGSGWSRRRTASGSRCC